jgi:hypothetical protein
MTLYQFGKEGYIQVIYILYLFMQIIFVDTNKQLCQKVLDARLCPVYNGSIFDLDWVIVTASNPRFSMGWGLDRAISNRYPSLCNWKKSKLWGNERIADIIFTITVGDDIVATFDLVREAIEFAIENTREWETLLLSWLGTWIWWLPEDEFINILSVVLQNQWSHQSM